MGFVEKRAAKAYYISRSIGKMSNVCLYARQKKRITKIGDEQFRKLRLQYFISAEWGSSSNIQHKIPFNVVARCDSICVVIGCVKPKRTVQICGGLLHQSECSILLSTFRKFVFVPDTRKFILCTVYFFSAHNSYSVWNREERTPPTSRCCVDAVGYIGVKFMLALKIAVLN